MTSYFANHGRRERFPWSLYHAPLTRAIAAALRDHGPSPRVLVVGCGLEPVLPDAPPRTRFHACDVDPDAVRECRRLFPELAARIVVSSPEGVLPESEGVAPPFDVVVAKEVVEHLADPAAWARQIARYVALGGELVLTTPDYGPRSTLALLERTALEWVARRDGYSRRDIHPSRFDRRRLAALDVGPGMRLVSTRSVAFGWALVGRWRREAVLPT